jgi:glycerol-3-phosphate acyltransferase PlsY
MNFILIIAIAVAAYLLGSIPTAVWTGKLFFGIDIRKHGSGNAGATNTFRVLGAKAGIPVLLIDILKGFAAVKLSGFLKLFPEGSEHYIILQLLCCVLVVTGHLFPLLAGFKGGKGVATTLGAVFAIYPGAALSCAGIWLVCFLLTNYVSLSSIIAGCSFPFISIVVFKVSSLSLIIFSFLVAAIFILTHLKNIGRLLRNEESRIYLFRKKPEIRDKVSDTRNKV